MSFRSNQNYFPTRTIAFLIAVSLPVVSFNGFADVAESGYNTFEQGIKIEAYVQGGIPNSVYDITIKIKNRTDKAIILLEDSFSGFPILSKDMLKNAMLDYIKLFEQQEKATAYVGDSCVAFARMCLYSFGAFWVTPLIVEFFCRIGGTKIKNDDMIAIAGLGGIAGFFYPAIFCDSIKGGQDKVGEKFNNLQENIYKELEKDSVIFTPPLTIQPNELKEMHIYTQKRPVWADDLWIDIYDSSAKNVVARFCKRIPYNDLR